jgi:hypothetical protein
MAHITASLHYVNGKKMEIAWALKLGLEIGKVAIWCARKI